MEGALEVERLSLSLCLCGSSVRGNWRGAGLLGHPGGCVKEGFGEG